MKKYVTLDKDLSELVDQVNAYLATKNIDSPAYKIQLYHPIGAAEELIESIPAIATAFADEGLTIKGLGHYSIDNMVRPVPVKISMLLVPLKDTENSQFHINNPKPTALPFIDYVVDYEYYSKVDCEILETLPANPGAVFLSEGGFYSIENTGTNLAQYLVIVFNEDVSSYFSE